MFSSKGFLAPVIFVLALFIFAPSVKAVKIGNINLTNEKIIPGSTAYSFKRLGEKIKPAFILSKKAKAAYRCSLLDKRLSELALLVEKKTTKLIEISGQRYAAQAGVCETQILKTKLDQHQKVLASLRDNFPANSTYWLAIQQDIDTLNILSSN